MNLLYFALILVVPFVFSNNFFQGFELPKVLLFYAVCDIIFLGFVFFKKHRFFKLDNWDLMALSYLAIVTLSSIIAGNFPHSFLGGPYRYQGVLTQAHLAGLFMVTRRLLPRLDKIFIFTGIIHSIFIGFQFFWINFLGYEITNYAGRVVGTLGEPNYVAGILVVSLAFSLGYHLLTHQSRYVFYSLIIFFGILTTESMGGFLASIIIGFVYLYRLKRQKLFLILLILTLGLAVYFGYQKEKITYNKFGIQNIESRASIWPASFNLFLKRPLIGYGSENLAYVFPSEFGGSSIDRAHNVILDHLLVGGIFLGFVYLMLVLGGFKESGKHKAALPASLALLGIFIRDQVNVSGITNLYFFWIVLALCLPYFSSNEPKKKV